MEIPKNFCDLTTYRYSELRTAPSTILVPIALNPGVDITRMRPDITPELEISSTADTDTQHQIRGNALSLISAAMIVHPVVTTAVKTAMVQAIPSLAQFSSMVAKKAVAVGVPAVAAATVPALRGGAVVVDLDRADIRLDSLEQYCVIASIILGAVIDIYGDTPKERGRNQGGSCGAVIACYLCLSRVSGCHVPALWCLHSLDYTPRRLWDLGETVPTWICSQRQA